MRNKKIKAVIPVIFILSMIFTTIVYADDWYEKEDGYYTIYDQTSNKVLCLIAAKVSQGDEYVSDDNKLYEVIKVKDKNHIAYAKYKEEIKLPEISSTKQEALALMAKQQNRIIGIYHTHSDESYVPTDGTSSINGKGGIYKVGDALTASLKKDGVQVIHRQELHLPHDAGAYRRSRPTNKKILQQAPAAVFDVHRDAIPSEQYDFKVNGKPATKVRIVLGQKNQNIEKNKNLAYKLKAVADEMYPGMIKDIYIGKGNYNQDMAPNSALLEIGTHENKREAAENTANVLGNVLTVAVFGGQKQVAAEDGQPSKIVKNTEPAQTDNTGTSRGLLIVLGIAIVLGVGYLFISNSGKELRSKFGDKFSSFLGNRKK
ncbi:stage II sporulation protein P [Garciella nitratireducens]|uniref:stage II sporulation protein P n=1 Tax=Garciella nitratireducens TaxID=218205 RepID=UPI001BD1D3B6|nr:stage II sporulation protein P [Garciella nitratireducens]